PPERTGRGEVLRHRPEPHQPRKHLLADDVGGRVAPLFRRLDRSREGPSPARGRRPRGHPRRGPRRLRSGHPLLSRARYRRIPQRLGAMAGAVSPPCCAAERVQKSSSTSARRFSERPLGLSEPSGRKFGLRGFAEPKASVTIWSGFTPWRIRAWRIASARRSL